MPAGGSNLDGRSDLLLAWRLAQLLGTTVGATVPHLVARRRGHSPWPQKFLRKAVRVAGFDVRIMGTPRLHDVFYVANHISWIDILAMGSATGCAFISKDGVGSAPIVGWLAAQNNTVFVTRERRGEVASHIDAVRSALAAHQPIALFPEGGTGDGETLGPFKPPLFEVLLPPPREIMIQPVVIDYGAATPLVRWGAENGADNARRILAAPGRKQMTLNFLEPFDPGAHPDRKTLAAETRQRIAATMGVV
jgi:1-acyl-sn-glycerol-3-phosphate acyltransferase